MGKKKLTVGSKQKAASGETRTASFVVKRLAKGVAITFLDKGIQWSFNDAMEVHMMSSYAPKRINNRSSALEYLYQYTVAEIYQRTNMKCVVKSKYILSASEAVALILLLARYEELELLELKAALLKAL